MLMDLFSACGTGGDWPSALGSPRREPPQAEGSIHTSNSGKLHVGEIHGIGCTAFLSVMDPQSPVTSQQSRGWDLRQFAGKSVRVRHHSIVISVVTRADR